MNHSVSIDVQETVGDNEVGEVVGFCELFQCFILNILSTIKIYAKYNDLQLIYT